MELGILSTDQLGVRRRLKHGFSRPRRVEADRVGRELTWSRLISPPPPALTEGAACWPGMLGGQRRSLIDLDSAGPSSAPSFTRVTLHDQMIAARRKTVIQRWHIFHQFQAQRQNGLQSFCIAERR